MHLSAVPLCHVERHLLQLIEEETGHDFDGVGTLLLDVVARVSAIESFDRGFEEEESLWGSIAHKLEGSDGAATTGTGDEHLTFFLRVEINEVIAGHEARLHAQCTGQLCLFVACEDTFNGTMLDVIGVENGQLDSIADTVVSTECGAFGVHPVAVHISLDGIFGEVEVQVDQLVAHHIHVALYDGRSTVLITFRGGLAYQHVARVVDLGLKSMIFAKLFQVSDHLFLMLGRTGNLINLSKLLENASRFQFCHILLFFEMFWIISLRFAVFALSLQTVFALTQCKFSKNDRDFDPYRVNNCYSNGFDVGKSNIEEERQVRVAAHPR